MTEKELLLIIDHMMRARPKYVRGEQDCQWWVRHLFKLDGIELPESTIAASRDFVLVKGPLYAMDVVVFRNDAKDTISDLLEDRHVGVMINGREFTHFSQEMGIAKTEITRSAYAYRFSHAGRHKRYADQIGQ